jgi:hypothetical protein
VGTEQRLDPLSQQGITAACLIEKGAAFCRRPLDRGEEDCSGVFFS